MKIEDFELVEISIEAMREINKRRLPEETDNDTIKRIVEEYSKMQNEIVGSEV